MNHCHVIKSFSHTGGEISPNSDSRFEPMNHPAHAIVMTLGAFLPLRVGGADGERAGVRCSSHHLRIQEEGGRRPDGGEVAHPLRRNQSGSVMLEFVIAFPLVLVLMFACIQFSQIWIARMVVHYGAFCAARSALICKDTEYGSPGGNTSAPARAAINVCALLRQENGNLPVNRCQTTVANNPAWNVTATHTYQFTLITPIVGQIIAWGMNPWDNQSPWAAPEKNNNNTDSLGYPTITLTETVVLPKPYKTMVNADL